MKKVDAAEDLRYIASRCALDLCLLNKHSRIPVYFNHLTKHNAWENTEVFKEITYRFSPYNYFS